MTRFLSKQVFMRGANLFVLALLVAAYAGSATAAPITYVFTGYANGTLGQGEGQISFSETLLTVTASGNTDNVTLSGATYNNNTLSTTITIQGIGTMTVTPSTGNHDYVFDNQPSQKIGYGVTGIQFCCDIIQLVDEAYGSYDLKSSIGPVSDSPDLSTADWVNVPTSMGSLTVTNYTGNTFTATLNSQNQTLGPPGTTAIYTFNTDSYKITPLDNSGGESLTITAFLVPASSFPAGFLTSFPNERCIPYGDYSNQLGTDTCVEFQASCTTISGSPCNFHYVLATGYDLPSDLPAIGGPDFLVAHNDNAGNGNCAITSTSSLESIFQSYEVSIKDPTTRGGSTGPSCFVATYTPGAPLITTGIGFVGWQSPVVNTKLNLVKAGATRPLAFFFYDGSGNPVTNLAYCNAVGTTPGVCDSPLMTATATTPWINIVPIGIACKNGVPLNTSTDTISTPGNSAFLSNGNGGYQANWQTQKAWKGYCANVQVTYSTGGAANVVLFPASFGFQFN